MEVALLVSWLGRTRATRRWFSQRDPDRSTLFSIFTKTEDNFAACAEDSSPEDLGMAAAS